MAKDKSSFLLYADYLETFEDLSDKEAGQLIKHILRYVNDLNPEPANKTVKLAFGPIQRQMKRDLKGWEATIESKSTGGRMGNLKRYHPDLYDQVRSKGLTLEEAESIVKHRKASHTDKSESLPIASVAVNEHVHVNVNEHVKDKLNNNLFIGGPEQKNETIDEEINTLKLPMNHKTQFGATFSDLEPIEYIIKHQRIMYETQMMLHRAPDAHALKFNDIARGKHYSSYDYFQNAFIAHLKAFSNGNYQTTHATVPCNQRTGTLHSGGRKNFNVDRNK